MKYDFDYYNFKKSKILNNEVSLFKFTQKNGVYYIETGAKIYAFDEYNKMSNLIINVHFSDNIDIVSSNAHQKDHNNLSWIITENYNPISIAYKIKNNNSEYKNNTNNDLNPSVNKTDDNKSNTIKVSLKNDRNSLILVGLLFTLFLILIFIVIKFRWKRK